MNNWIVVVKNTDRAKPTFFMITIKMHNSDAGLFS